MVDETPRPNPQKGTRKPASEREPEQWSIGKITAAILGVCAIIAALILTLSSCGSDDPKSANASDGLSSDNSAGFKVVGTADQVTQKNLEDCPDKSKHFWADNAPAGSGAMGPPLVVTANDKGTQIARDRFWLKDKCDPAWTAHAREGIFVENPENFDPVKAQADAERYNSDEDAWQKATDELFAEIDSYELRDYGTNRYDSVGMIPNPDGPTSKMPTFTKWAEQPELHLVLVVKTKHHGERLFRVDCDLQFSAPKLVEFHAPPSVAPPPPPGTGTPPPPGTWTPPPPPPGTTTPPPPPTTPPTTTPTTTPPTTPPTTTPPPTTETLPPKIPTTNPSKPPGIVPLPLDPVDTLQPTPPTLTNRQTVPIPTDAPPVSQVPRTFVPPVETPVITIQNTPVPVPVPVPTNPGTNVGEAPPVP